MSFLAGKKPKTVEMLSATDVLNLKKVPQKSEETE